MKFFPILIVFLCTTVCAKTITSKIHAIDFGEDGNQDPLILLETGEVLKADAGKHLHYSEDDSVEVSWNAARVITHIKKIGEKKHEAFPARDLENFEPTVVNSSWDARNYFNQSRVSHGDTQCYNRAHVWSYELFKSSNVKTRKIFLFFSRKYIREHDFGWWFHVAPLIITKEWGGAQTEKVMDPRFLRAPRNIQWWTDKFVSSNETCKEISKYTDYADYPYSRDCFVMKVPMYIYQPLDLEMEELWGFQKNGFMKNDLIWAYKEAFNMDYKGE